MFACCYATSFEEEQEEGGRCVLFLDLDPVHTKPDEFGTGRLFVQIRLPFTQDQGAYIPGGETAYKALIDV